MDSSGGQAREKHTVAERLAGLRNFQSKDFWAMVFARPLTILFLLPVADVAWVTPNLITWASIVAKFAGAAALVACPSYWAGVLGVVLLNLGLILDNMDGTLARYRNCSSYLGFFLDKAGDVITLTVMFAALGVRVYMYGGTEAGNILDVAIPLAAGAGQTASWYCKWVAQKVISDMELRVHAGNGTLESYVSVRKNQNPAENPPARTFGQWIVWFAGAVKSIVYVNEVDIFFFIALFVVIDKPWIFTRFFCALYAAGFIVGPIMHYAKLRKTLMENGIK